MPNGQGISRETFVEADEPTRIALTFDLLSEIHETLIQQPSKCVKQSEDCLEKFASKDNVKWLTWGYRSLIIGIGGFLVWLILVI